MAIDPLAPAGASVSEYIVTDISGDSVEPLPATAAPRTVGGWVRGSWTRLRRWVEAERAESRNPNVGEWWQWLYERLEADPDPGKAQAAHVAYRGRSRR